MTEEKLNKAIQISHRLRNLTDAIEQIQDMDFIDPVLTDPKYTRYSEFSYISKERADELNEMLRQEAETNLREEVEKLKDEFEKL